MNNREAVMLVRYVRALCPNQKIDEYTPDAWSDVIADYELDDCRAACVALAARQPFIAPAEIITEVRKTRRARLENFIYEPPAIESTEEFLDNLRRQIAGVASGAIPAPTTAPALTGGPHKSVEEHLAGIGQQIPGRDEPRPPRYGPLGVHCPNCYSPIGRPCRTPHGKERRPHTARLAAAGTPGVDAPLPPEQAAAEEARRRKASQAHLEADGGAA